MERILNAQPEAGPKPAGRIPWGWAVGTALVMEVALIASAIGWVAIYSYAINPGQEPGVYEMHAQFSSPIVSIVLGIPFWFLACRWVGRKAGSRAVAFSLMAWLICFLIESPLYILGAATARQWLVIGISHSTKALAAYFGGRAASRWIERSKRE